MSTVSLLAIRGNNIKAPVAVTQTMILILPVAPYLLSALIIWMQRATSTTTDMDNGTVTEVMIDVIDMIQNVLNHGDIAIGNRIANHSLCIRPESGVGPRPGNGFVIDKDPVLPNSVSSLRMPSNCKRNNLQRQFLTGPV